MTHSIHNPVSAADRRHDAVVVFGDQADLFWMRILKPGFRHCFVLLELDHGWVMLDSLAHWMHVAIMPAAPSGELARWYRGQGYRAIVAHHHQPPRTPAPWAPFTCVETVKRALGIHHPGIWTPYQLWGFLNLGKKS